MRRNDVRKPIFAERRVRVSGACVGYNQILMVTTTKIAVVDHNAPATFTFPPLHAPATSEVGGAC